MAELVILEIPPARRLRVYLGEDDYVRNPGMTLELERREGDVVGFTLDAGRVRGIFFERRVDDRTAVR